ncbi:MAG: hypothetical protein JW779_10410 [Candidatus Thorarchaeota archaeon]|nr:hypothetical protein [Candidatus Thorarchaeota archaeon]
MMSEIYRLRIRLEPRSEISPREELPSRNFYPASPFISGKKVRGAFLTAIRRTMTPHTEAKRIPLSEHSKSKFQKEAVEGFLKASPALPRSESDTPREVPHAPFTFLSCKACEGEKKHLQLYDATGDLLKRGDLSQSTFCDKHKKPYFRKGYSGPVCLSSRKPLQTPEINTRPAVAIDGVTGSATSGGLFFMQTTTHHTPLITEIAVASGELVDMIRDLKKSRALLQLGAGRARGWGIVEIDDIEFVQSHSEFVKEKEASLQKVIEIYGGFVLIATSGIASVVLENDRFISRPYVLEVEGFNLEKSYGRVNSYTGWSMLTNLQKPMITGAKEGSIFFYRVPDISEVDFSKLLALELQGIGDRILTSSQMNQVVFWEGEH